MNLIYLEITLLISKDILGFEKRGNLYLREPDEVQVVLVS